MYVIWRCCDSGSVLSIMVERVTRDVIYIFAACHFDQSYANRLEESGSLWAFIKILPAILTGNKLGIIESVIRITTVIMMNEKQFVYVQANKRLLSSLWRVWCVCCLCLLFFTCGGSLLWLLPFLSIRLHDAAMDDSEFIIFLPHKYIISSLGSFEVTPAASYQFTHFTSLTLAWKSDSWYPLSHHCYLRIVNRRGFCYLYFTLEKCSFTSLRSGYQQCRLEQVTQGFVFFVLGVVIIIFWSDLIWSICFLYFMEGFSPHGSCL